MKNYILESSFKIIRKQIIFKKGEEKLFQWQISLDVFEDVIRK